MTWYVALSIVLLLVLMFCGIPVPIVFFATTIFYILSVFELPCSPFKKRLQNSCAGIGLL